MKIADARRKALENPLDAQAVCELGVTYARRGGLDTGIDFLFQAVASDNSEPGLHCALGSLLVRAERFVEAACAYRQALRLDPDHVPALNGLGDVAIRRHDAEVAVSCFRRAVDLVPGEEPSRTNLAGGLNILRSFKSAAAEARKSIKLNPASIPAHFQLVSAMHGLGRFKASLRVLGRLLTRNPDSIDARHLVVQALNNLDFDPKAPAICRRALAKAPKDAIMHFELGAHALATGDWRTGWREYEWRFSLPGQRIDHFRLSRPLAGAAWTGQNLDGKTLFVHCEQGLGDTLQFIRFLPELAKMNCKLIVLVQPELATLLQCLSNIAMVIPFLAPNPPHDYQIPLHSIPRVLETTIETLPCRVPYLSAPSDLPAGATLDRIARLRVAFFWATRELSSSDHRNAPLRGFEPLFDIGAVAFYSLQINKSADELEPYLRRANVHSLKPCIRDMRDTASLLCHMDLLITIDSAVAHLAGALGLRVWLLLPTCASWRWLRGGPKSRWGAKSPWYPNMRLFRCRKFGDWQPVFHEVRDNLLELLSAEDRRGHDQINQVAP